MKTPSRIALLLSLVSLASFRDLKADVLATTHLDFSTAAQGTAGFQYGYYTEANSTAGTFSTANMVVSEGEWHSTGSNQVPFHGVYRMHTGVDGKTSAVRRYTVGSGSEPAFSGTVRIAGRFYSMSSGATVRFVTVDGVTVFTTPESLGESTFYLTANVSSPDSTIDFGIAPGANANSDTTGLMAWIVSGDTPLPTSIVANAYNSPNDRAQCFVLATDGTAGSTDETSFDTGSNNGFPYQFAGLIYPEAAGSGKATRFDSVRIDVLTSGDFSDTPRLYLLRHNSDPASSNPAMDDRYARLPVIPVRNATNSAGQPYYTFDLTALTAAERTGYGFAVVGASVGTGGTIAVSEIAATATRVPDSAVIAPQPFLVSSGGHRYGFSVVRADWEQAETSAVAAGGHLVTINDALEQSYLVSQFGTENVFIGLKQDGPDAANEPSGGWRWRTGELLSDVGAYINWNGGEPNGFEGAEEDYGFMNFSTPGTWGDVRVGGYPHTSTYRGIIEVPTAGSGAQNFFIASIPATSNIFDAGLASATQGGSLPPSINVSSLDGSTMTFPQIVGVLDTAADRHGPDGAHTAGRSCDLTSVGGISGYLNGNNTPALVAVFLGASQPASVPARLDFSTSALGENFTTLAPALGQVFFIGDGFTNGGIAQQFVIPAGATKLYFGLPDGYDGTLYHGTPAFYGDNSGSVSLRAVVTPSATPTITSAQFPITGGQLAIFGGTGPYTVTLLSGSLPPGITISSTGLVSGTAANGTYTFTLHVVDSGSPSASSNRTFTVVIENTVSVPSAIIDWWPGEGAVGDIIGGYHGSLKNGATYGAGKVGRGFVFDGVNDYLEVPSTSALNLAGDFTIEGWINITSASGQPTIIGKRSADASDIPYLLYLTNGQLSFASSLANSLTFSYADTPITAATWHHVAATLTGGQLRLYVDGSLVKTVAWSGPRPSVSEPATIGATVDTAHPSATPVSAFPGSIDELSLYSRALTLSEINAIHLAGSQGKARHDVARDYSTSSNNGPVWSYRWIPSTDVNTAYDPTAANANFLSGPNPTGGNGVNSWGSNPAVSYNTTDAFIGGSYTFAPRQFTMHPGPSGELSIARWKAPHAGRFAVSGTFYGTDATPTTTDVHIFHNATQLTGTDKRSVNSYRGDGVSHTQIISVAANDTVDFLVGPGGNGYNSDSTGLAASIVEVGPDSVPNIQVTQTYGGGSYTLGYLFNAGTATAGSPNIRADYFTITNTGTAPLTGLGDVGPGLGVRVTGVAAADYVVSPFQPLGTLGVGESTIIYLVFNPTAVGTRSAALHFATNDPDQPDFYINLTGVGITAGTGERVDGFNPNASDGAVLDVVSLSDGSGKYIVTGNFTTIGGQTHNRIARMNADGSIDSAFQAGAGDSVITAVMQSDGKIIIGGYFTTVTGTNGTFGRYHLARLNADGTVDENWYPFTDGSVLSLAIEPGGTLLVGGAFNNVNGPNPVPRLARLNLNDTGSLHLDFTPGFDGLVGKIVIYEGKILVGGTFTTIGGASLPYFARLNANGTADSTFSPPVLDGEVKAIAIDFFTGKIFIGGSFSTADGWTLVHIARLNPGGTLDPSFVGSTSGAVSDILWQIDGKIVIGGFFDQVWSQGAGWQPWRRIARLDTNGYLDWSFPAQAGAADYGVFALADQYDDYGLNIIVGGSFSTMGGLPRNNLARVAPPVPDIHVVSTGAITHTDGSTRDFGTAFVGNSTGPVIFTIQNVGSALLYTYSGAGGITIDGTNAAAFSLSGAGATSLATGASVPITINFTPQGQGAHEAWLHIHSNDPDEEPFDIKLIGSGGVPITDWRQQNFGTSSNTGNAADDADPDHDGISNLMEFATAGAPNTNNTAPTSVTPPSGSFIEFIYTRNKLAMAELGYEVQWTDDLLTAWSSAGVTETILSDNGTVQQVKALVPKGATSHRFVRLKVTRP